MNSAKYFKIVSVSDHVVHVENSGFWSDEAAEQIGNAYLIDFRRAAKGAARTGPFIVLADLRRLEVLSRKGRVALSRVMNCAKQLGMYKAVEVIPNAITRLSVQDAARLTGESDFRIVTDSFDKAMTMVETFKREMQAAPIAESSSA